MYTLPEVIDIINEGMLANAATNKYYLINRERSFIVVGEWDSAEALAAARPAMIANLDRLRPLLEDLGGGRGPTEPWSGEVALHLGA